MSNNFQFGTSKDTIQDTSGAPRLGNPFIGKVNLINVEKRTIEGKDGSKYPNVLAFVWKVKEGEDIAGKDVAGFVTEKLEWEPREEDSQEKVTNKTGRVGYIMSKYLPEEEAIIDASQIKSWEHFVDTVVQRFQKNPDYKKKVTRLKVPASDYQGKVTFDVPNYKGFIQSSKEDSPLDFTNREQQANAKWLQTKNVAADSAPEGGNTIAEDDDLF